MLRSLARLLFARPSASVTMYRVCRADELDAAFVDQGDEALLGRYVGEELRRGAGLLMIDRVELSRADAEGLSERMLDLRT